MHRMYRGRTRPTDPDSAVAGGGQTDARLAESPGLSPSVLEHLGTLSECDMADITSENKLETPLVL
jgi:hypothetical protein